VQPASAELEPVRWVGLRRGVTFVAWGTAIGLIPCGQIVSIPMLVVGARDLMRWAPDPSVRAAAERLLYSVIVGPVLLLATWIALSADAGSVEVTVLTLAATGAGVLQVVSLVQTLRRLARWTAVDALIERWDRSVKLLPFAIGGVIVAALLTTVLALAMLATAALSFWALWLVGYPVWCTSRLFRAALGLFSPLPPPPPDPLWGSAR
jgi:hypothetical protein